VRRNLGLNSCCCVIVQKIVVVFLKCGLQQEEIFQKGLEGNGISDERKNLNCRESFLSCGIESRTMVCSSFSSPGTTPLKMFLASS